MTRSLQTQACQHFWCKV